VRREPWLGEGIAGQPEHRRAGEAIAPRPFAARHGRCPHGDEARPERAEAAWLRYDLLEALSDEPFI
jgi:hypothetical protein